MKAEDIIKKYPGFSVWPTGGNCEGWGHSLGNGGHLLITDAEDPSLPEEDAKVVGIGMYDENSDQVKYKDCRVKDLERTIDRWLKEGATHRKEPKNTTRVPIPVQFSKRLFVFDCRDLPDYMSKTLFIRQYMTYLTGSDDYRTFQPFHLSSDIATYKVWVVSTKRITESQAKKIGTVALWLEEFFGVETYGEFKARVLGKGRRRGAK